jgi:Xaa-Pro dipeptidase
MSLHFKRNEFSERLASARIALRQKGLDAILLFSQESLYYLTGYDTSGYVFFQCGILMADDQPFTLLTRRPDLEQARQTSIIGDIRLWYDAEGSNPALDLKEILREKDLKGACIGIEMATYGLTAANYEKIRVAFNDWCQLQDASDVVRRLRLVKSQAEIAYIRRAAELADNALIAMIEATRPCAFEGDILAAGQNAIFHGGGDVAPTGPVLGSGERALLIRTSTGMTHLKKVDQLTIEFAGSYRRYTSCLMRTLLIGETNPLQERMFWVTLEALTAMSETVKPGRSLGEIDDAHRRVYDAAGYSDQRMAACGYSLGATYRPTWMDVPPMLYSGNPLLAQQGMVFFMHAILCDTQSCLAMSLGYTVVVTETGCDVLSRLVPVFEARR